MAFSLACTSVAQRFVHPFPSVDTYVFQDVRVAVHRLRDWGVPGQRLHCRHDLYPRARCATQGVVVFRVLCR
jgi:hypothetical protein